MKKDEVLDFIFWAFKKGYGKHEIEEYLIDEGYYRLNDIEESIKFVFD